MPSATSPADELNVQPRSPGLTSGNDTHWSHKEIQASSIDIDSSGSLICLAGKRFLALVSANSPGVIDSKCSRSSRWDAVCCKWRPNTHGQGQAVLAVASGQSLELYANRETGLERFLCVKAHPRNLTDLDWSPPCNELLATASIDDSVHIWDLRDIKKPKLSLDCVAGATQVKWCKLTENQVATAHYQDVQIWDIRKSSNHIQYISTHVKKVNSLDWHPADSTCFATASQDSSIKIWQSSSPMRPKAQVLLETPVWKMKFSPDGGAVAAVWLPQGGRAERTVPVWQSDGLHRRPLESLHVHGDVISDLCWRPGVLGGYQLFSVAKDNTLRLWHVAAPLPPPPRVSTPADDVSGEDERMVTNVEGVLFGLGNTTITADDKQMNSETDVTDDKQPTKAEALPAFPIAMPYVIGSMEREMKAVRQLEHVLNSDEPLSIVIDQTSVEHSDTACNVRLKVTNYGFSVGVRMMVQQNGAECLLSVEIDSDNTSTSLKPAQRITLLNQLQRFCKDRALNSDGQEPILAACIKQIHAIELSSSATTEIEVSQPSVNEPQTIASTAVSVSQLTSPSPPVKHNTSSTTSSTATAAPASPRVPTSGRPYQTPVPQYLGCAWALDPNVPFPRTTGASFNSAGLLVCFGRTEPWTNVAEGGRHRSHSLVINDSADDPMAGQAVVTTLATPRSLAAIASPVANGGTMSSLSQQLAITVRDYYTIATAAVDYAPYVRVGRSVGGGGSAVVPQSSFHVVGSTSNLRSAAIEKESAMKHVGSTTMLDGDGVGAGGGCDAAQPSQVFVYDLSSLLPCSKALAQQYTLASNDSAELCEHNRLAACSTGRHDLAQVWSVLRHCVDSSLKTYLDPDIDYPWSCSPFGREIVNSLLDYYGRLGDVQTAAMICCVLGEKRRHFRRRPLSLPSSPQAGIVMTVAKHHSTPTAQAAASQLQSSELQPRRSLSTLTGGNATSPPPPRQCQSPPGGGIFYGSPPSSHAVLYHTPATTAPQPTESSTSNYNTVHMGALPSTSMTISSNSTAVVGESELVTFHSTATPVPAVPTATPQQPHDTGRQRSNSLDLDDPMSSPSGSPSTLQALGGKLAAGIHHMQQLAGYLPAMAPPASTSLTTTNTTTSITDQRLQTLSLPLVTPLSTQQRHDLSVSLLDAALAHRAEGAKQAYADLLQRWGLFVEATQVLKYSDAQSDEVHSGCEYLALCRGCGRECYASQCSYCKELPLECVVCQMAVKGLSSVCPLCGHGGHMNHMIEWFTQSGQCPAACGCSCLS